MSRPPESAEYLVEQLLKLKLQLLDVETQITNLERTLAVKSSSAHISSVTCQKLWLDLRILSNRLNKRLS